MIPSNSFTVLGVASPVLRVIRFWAASLAFLYFTSLHSSALAQEFFNAGGFSINMCEETARRRALDLGFVPVDGPGNAPPHHIHFSHPSNSKKKLELVPERNEGKLQLGRIDLRVPRTQPDAEVSDEVRQIEALYGSGACRVSSARTQCQGSREVGPYDIDVRATYRRRDIIYRLRAKFVEKRIFDPSPPCTGDSSNSMIEPPEPDKNEKPPEEDAGSSISAPGTLAGSPGTPGSPSPTSGTNEPADKPKEPSKEEGETGSTAESSSTSESASQNSVQRIYEAAVDMETEAFAKNSFELHAQAAELYGKACDLGHSESCFNLSRKYAKGEGVEQNTDRELELLRKAAEQGLPEAQFNLALEHATSSGGAEDQALATDLFCKAAAGGDVEAMVECGKRKLMGKGTPQSDEEAIEQFEEAAANGSAEAQYILGLMLEQGGLMAMELDRSQRYFCMAADNGHGPAASKCTRERFLPPNDNARLGRDIRY